MIARGLSYTTPRGTALLQGDDINDKDSFGTLLDFMALQRARVPAFRDAVEKARSEIVMSSLRIMDTRGLLPPKPPGHESVIEGIEVAIDPHQSLTAMASQLDGIDRVYSEIGLGALRNKTNTPFLTSDNPVIWFDSSVSEIDIQPYVWRPGTPLVFIFPVAPDLMIYGHSSMRKRFVSNGFSYADLSDPKNAEMMNRQICRFAYEAVFAQLEGQETLIREHADLSPILQISRLPGAQGETLFLSSVFGPRKRKAKWTA